MKLEHNSPSPRISAIGTSAAAGHLKMALSASGCEADVRGGQFAITGDEQKLYASTASASKN